MNSRGEVLALIALLLVAGGLAWWLNLKEPHSAVAETLDRVPRTLNGWQSRDIAVDPEVSDLLRADFNVQRVYTHPQGFAVFVYVGYYGTERGGAPEHTPDVCYPSQGWEIEENETLFVGDTQNGFSVREFIVERDDSRRLVHFWYRTESATGFTSTITLRLRHFWSRLTENRGDGALVRVSTVLAKGDRDGSLGRGRLLSFDQAIEAALDEHWPQSNVEDMAAKLTTSPISG